MVVDEPEDSPGPDGQSIPSSLVNSCFNYEHNSVLIFLCFCIFLLYEGQQY